MEKEQTGIHNALKCAGHGLLGFCLLLALLTAAGALMPEWEVLQKHTGITAAVCLLISAALCGNRCCRGNETGLLVRSLSGEAVLLLLVLLRGLLSAKEVTADAALMDAIVVLIGGFAGILTSGRGKTKKRSRRKYNL